MSVKLDLGFMTFDLREIPAYARRAEELGVGALWSAETKHDPFLPLAVAGANTSRVQLGTAIAVAFSRSPMILAHTAWDLQKASGGRFVLGLGTQVKAHNERRFLGEVGAAGAAAARGGAGAPRDLGSGSGGGARQVGALPQGLHLPRLDHGGGGKRRRRARTQQAGREAADRLLRLDADQAVLAVHGLDHLVPRLHAKSLEGDWQGMADLISDETLDHFAVTATWETLAGKLRDRYDGICDRTQLYPAFQPLIRKMNP